VRRDSVTLQGAGLIGSDTCRSHSRRMRSCTGSRTESGCLAVRAVAHRRTGGLRPVVRLRLPR